MGKVELRQYYNEGAACQGARLCQTRQGGLAQQLHSVDVRCASQNVWKPPAGSRIPHALPPPLP